MALQAAQPHLKDPPPTIHAGPPLGLAIVAPCGAVAGCERRGENRGLQRPTGNSFGESGGWEGRLAAFALGCLCCSPVPHASLATVAGEMPLKVADPSKGILDFHR